MRVSAFVFQGIEWMGATELNTPLALHLYRLSGFNWLPPWGNAADLVSAGSEGFRFRSEMSSI